MDQKRVSSEVQRRVISELPLELVRVLRQVAERLAEGELRVVH